MSIMGLCGFGGLNTSRDQLTVVVGSVTYQTSNLPNADTDVCLQGSGGTSNTIRHQWDKAEAHFWVHYHYRDQTNDTFNDGVRLGWASGGVMAGAVSFEDSTNKLTIWVQGTGVVATAASAALSVLVWESIHVEVTLDGAAGTIDVYTNGDLVTPVVSFVGNTDTAALVTCDEFFCTIRLSDRLANLIALDPDDATGVVSAQQITSPGIRVLVPDADGFYTAWTATPGAGAAYEDIDERPANDAEYVEATAVGQRSTYSHETVGAVAAVSAVKWYGRMKRTGTAAGANVSVTRRLAATDYDEGAVGAPGDGDVSQIWDEKPGGGAWTSTDLDNTEFGVLSVT